MDRISTSGRAIIIDVKFFQLYLLVLMNEQETIRCVERGTHVTHLHVRIHVTPPFENVAKIIASPCMHG